MRFRDIYVKCKKENENIEEYHLELYSCYKEYKDNRDDFIYETYKSNFKQLYRGFSEYAIRKFIHIPYFREVLSQIKNSIDEDANVESQMHIFDIFYLRVQCIFSMYETIENVDINNIGLDIKIPKTDNLTELKKYIDGLEFVFTKCPFLQNHEESLKLQAVDNGSIWLIFGVVGASVAAGSVLLNNIAAFIDKCFVIRSHKLTCEKQKQEVKNAEIEQNEKEELFKSINKMYKIAVDNAIKGLEASTGYQIQDGDESGRVEQSFERMGKMLEQGLQIYSAINSTEEVKAVFAPLEMHYLEIEKGLKRIEEKTDTDAE